MHSLLPGLRSHVIQQFAYNYGNLETENLPVGNKACIFLKVSTLSLIVGGNSVDPAPSKVSRYILFGNTLRKGEECSLVSMTLITGIKAATRIYKWK